MRLMSDYPHLFRVYESEECSAEVEGLQQTPARIEYP